MAGIGMEWNQDLNLFGREVLCNVVNGVTMINPYFSIENISINSITLHLHVC